MLAFSVLKILLGLLSTFSNQPTYHAQVGLDEWSGNETIHVLYNFNLGFFLETAV